jgi:hypothetical protein
MSVLKKENKGSEQCHVVRCVWNYLPILEYEACVEVGGKEKKKKEWPGEEEDTSIGKGEAKYSTQAWPQHTHTLSSEDKQTNKQTNKHLQKRSGKG